MYYFILSILILIIFILTEIKKYCIKYNSPQVIEIDYRSSLNGEPIQFNKLNI